MNHWIFEAEFPVFPFKCWVWYSRFLRSWDPWGWMKVLTSHSVLSFCKKLCFTLSGKGYKHKMHFRVNKKNQNQWHECFDVWWCFTYTKSINIIYNIVFIPFFMFTESFRVPHFYYGPDKNGFSLGSVMKNAEQVLGLNRWYWFLPVYTRWDFSVVYSNHL